MFVYFVRHASAGQHKADPAKDEKRPLDSDGIEQCNTVGRGLAALDTHVDLILSSPLKRASQTASLVANELAYEDKIVLTPSLRPDATYAKFTALLDEYARHEAIMVVGHNPNLSEFLGRVIGGGGRAGIELKKGAVARVEVDRRRGILHWMLTPKTVRTLSKQDQ
ncbi:MAG: phosphohistidine phosphatase SixA [Terriglobales bacterium]